MLIQIDPEMPQSPEQNQALAEMLRRHYRAVSVTVLSDGRHDGKLDMHDDTLSRLNAELAAGKTPSLGDPESAPPTSDPYDRVFGLPSQSAPATDDGCRRNLLAAEWERRATERQAELDAIRKVLCELAFGVTYCIGTGQTQLEAWVKTVAVERKELLKSYRSDSPQPDWKARIEAAEREVKDVHALLDSKGVRGDAKTAAEFKCHPPTLRERVERLLFLANVNLKGFRVPARGDKVRCVKKPVYSHCDIPVNPGDVLTASATDVNFHTCVNGQAWALPLSCFEPV